MTSGDYNVISVFTEPEYEFEKPIRDTDAYEKETAEFTCEVNDPQAPVKWFKEDKVNEPTGIRIRN